jgi:hypothetical protein
MEMFKKLVQGLFLTLLVLPFKVEGCSGLTHFSHMNEITTLFTQYKSILDSPKTTHDKEGPSFTLNIEDSCKSKGKISYYYNAIATGLNCIDELNSNGKMDFFFARIRNDIGKKPITIKCNETDYSWDGVEAFATPPNQKNLDYPLISINPNVKIKKSRVFHEYIHLLGFLHNGKDIEYAYACESYCFDNDINSSNIKLKEKARRICVGDYPGVTSLEYLSDLRLVMNKQGALSVYKQILERIAKGNNGTNRDLNFALADHYKQTPYAAFYHAHIQQYSNKNKLEQKIANLKTRSFLDKYKAVGTKVGGLRHFTTLSKDYEKALGYLPTIDEVKELKRLKNSTNKMDKAYGEKMLKDLEKAIWDMMTKKYPSGTIYKKLYQLSESI